ncbi:peptidase M61, partial [Sulfolobus sp. F3]
GLLPALNVISFSLPSLNTLRSNLIKPNEGLKKILNSLHNLTFPGSKRVSLSEASKTAWIKYYKQDENFLNSSVSYYDGGLALGFYTDLKLIERGKRIDEVFISLRDKGKYTFEDLDRILTNLGFDELYLAYRPAYEIFKALRDYIHLEVFDKDKPYYGIILDGNKVRFVEDDSPADFAGLMPDDQIISIDNTAKPLEVRESVILHVLREGRLKEITLRAGKSP